MHAFYANPPPPAHPWHHQPPPVNAIQHGFPTPHIAPTTSHDPLLSSFDKMLKKKFTNANANFHDAISRHVPPEHQEQLRSSLKYLRIYKHLFMHTYVHLVSCCRGKNLNRLLGYATEWARWDSVKQLSCHSLIKYPLSELLKDRECKQHQSLVQNFAINHDDNDLLCHLLYCSRNPVLYDLHGNQPVAARHEHLKESEQVIELLWTFLLDRRGNEDDMRRLRACIYRMARKYAYLPHGLQVRASGVSDKGYFGGSGANSSLQIARMQSKDVIIKRIAPKDGASKRTLCELFASEAILWGTLQHKNVVPFLGVVFDDKGMGLISPFFRNGDIMKYMDGYNSEQRLASARKLSRGLAEALKYIHSHEPPIIHGDLKANNVLVDDGGNACLGDFGQSHASDSGKYLDSTRVGRPESNFEWLAPEILQGSNTLCSAKSDIYAFGCVLYEMISNRTPFNGDREHRVITCILRGERPKKPKWIDENLPLWRVAEDCWKPRPEDRPSATALVRLLR